MNTQGQKKSLPAQKNIFPALLVAFTLTAAAPTLSFAAAAEPASLLNEIDAKASSPDRSTEGKQDKLKSYIESAMKYMERMAAASESSWNPAATTRADLRKKINSILREAIDVLSSSTLRDLKEGADKLQADNDKLLKLIAADEIKKSSAPSTVGKLDFTTWTKKHYADRIAKSKATIADNKQSAVEIAERMQHEFEKQGVRISKEQVNGLLVSVTGEEDVRVFASIETVKAITIKLKADVQGTQENIELAKRYFGIHVLLLRATIVVQEDYVNRIKDEFLPSLKNIENRTNDRLAASAKKQKDTSIAQDVRDSYADNDKADKITLAAIDLYRQHLNRVRVNMEGSKEQGIVGSIKPLKDQYDLAEMRYMQVKDASTLLDIMNRANANLSQIMNLSAPQLLSFQNQEVATKFDELTRELARK